MTKYKKIHGMILVFHRAKFKTTDQDVAMQNSVLTCVQCNNNQIPRSSYRLQM